MIGYLNARHGAPEASNTAVSGLNVTSYAIRQCFSLSLIVSRNERFITSTWVLHQPMYAEGWGFDTKPLDEGADLRETEVV